MRRVGTLRRGYDLHHHLKHLGATLLGKAKVAAELFGRGRYQGRGRQPEKGNGLAANF